MVAASNDMGFRENLRRLRDEREWTLTELAEHAGLSWRSIQNWELGVREPQVGPVLVLAEVFGVTVDELLAGELDEYRKAMARKRRQKRKEG